MNGMQPCHCHDFLHLLVALTFISRFPVDGRFHFAQQVRATASAIQRISAQRRLLALGSPVADG
jgi:hypothetical protein